MSSFVSRDTLGTEATELNLTSNSEYIYIKLLKFKA